MGERIFAVCVAAFFAFMAYGVKAMPPFIAWIGASCALIIAGLTFTSINPRLILPSALMGVALVGFAAAANWFHERYSEGLPTSPEAIARLAELGWTVKPGSDNILFEIANAALPPMEASAVYFSQINKPFRLHFQNVKSLDGLHYLANNAGCTNIEIGAGEFTDISELRGFVHLTKLGIGQVPLNGVGIVDPSPLASLVNLRELVLGMTRIRTSDFLASLKSLKRLYLGRTLITDISSLSSLPLLEFLDIRDTRVNDLTPLENAANLNSLEIGGEQLPGLASLSGLTNLKRLTLIQQGPVDLTNVSVLDHLENLFVWGATSLDLQPLQKLAQLQSLHLSGPGPGSGLTVVGNPQVIGDLSQLKILTLGYMQISNLSFVSSLKDLTELTIGTMPVTSIAVLQGLKNIKKISLTDVPVVDVSPLLNLPNLSELYLLRVPARVDVLKELERRGVKVTNY